MWKGHRAACIGLVAAALTMFVLCCAVAAITPPLGTADETAHLDYAVQVWHGHLPVFLNGLATHPPKFAAVPPVQWESQHPPLFYVIMAPVAGPLVDAGHWVAATVAVRVADALLTSLIAFAVGWAAWALGGRERWSRAITAAAVAGTVGAVVYVGGSAYSDNINTLMSAVAIGLALYAVSRGLSPRVLIAACVVSAAGALGRTEFVMAFVVLLVGLALAAFLHGPRRGARFGPTLVMAGIAVALPVISAAGAAGWFYLRNKRLTGNFSGSQPAWAAAHLGRRTMTLGQVLHNQDFLNTQYSLLRHPIDGRSSPTLLQHRIDTPVMVTLFSVVAALGLLVLVVQLRRALHAKDMIRLASIALLALLTVLTLGFEVSFTMGGGGTISRYLLPALVPIALLLSAGLRIGSNATRPYLLAAYLLICQGMFSYWLLEQPHAPGTTPTGVPWALVTIVPPVVLVLVVVQVLAVRAAQAGPPARAVSAAVEPATAAGR